MATFTSWADEYARAKNALATRTWNDYFLSSVVNHEEMRTTFTKLENVTMFVDWLCSKAAEEAGGYVEGGMITIVGGY